MRSIVIASLVLALSAALSACGQQADETASSADSAAPQTSAAPSIKPSSDLDTILAGLPEAHQARYVYRNPGQTIEFLGLEPGMKVAEVLPGGGWYSKILVPYLGAEGQLVAIDYPLDMWSNFDFATDEFLEKRDAMVQKWVTDTEEWGAGDGASASAYNFATLPDDLTGSLDAVLFIRALHNMARFESKGEFLTKALQETYRILKPGGLVGVVQHAAPETSSDEWADGSRGYLKQAFVIAQMENAGFTFEAQSDINANPNDQPGENDIVWRLPPNLATSGDNAELKQKYLDIGESNRMTLTFRKPSEG